MQVVPGDATLGELASGDGKLSLGSIQRCESLSQLVDAALLPGCTALSLSGGS